MSSNAYTGISRIVNDCNLGLCVPTYIGESLASVLRKICDEISEGGSGGCCYTFVNSSTVTFLRDGNIISASATAGLQSFDAGNLAPLFTTDVATPDSTPFLSFSLNKQAANKVFAGPISGANDYPFFRSLVWDDMPFDEGDFIQNQGSIAQFDAKFWIDGYGRIEEYLRLGDGGRLEESAFDANGLDLRSNIDPDPGEDRVGGSLRLTKLKFFTQQSAFVPPYTEGDTFPSNSYIYSPQGDRVDLFTPYNPDVQSASGFDTVGLNTSTITFGNGINPPRINVGGYHPLVVSGEVSTLGLNFDFIKIRNANYAPTIPSEAGTESYISYEHYTDDGAVVPPVGHKGTLKKLGRAGIIMTDYLTASFKSDYVIKTADATINSGEPTEYFRITNDGKIIANSYSTLLTPPATNGVTKMLICDEDGLFSFDSIPAGASGSVTSVALQMPSAFSVANSPITNAGTLIVTGTGTTSQYIKGDGSLGNFIDATVPLSSLTPAIATNLIQNGNFDQTWDWNGSLSNEAALRLRLTGVTNGTGLKIEVNATNPIGGQRALEISMIGVSALNAPSTAAYITNHHTGTGVNYGLLVDVANGADNYAALFQGGKIGMVDLQLQTGNDKLVGHNGGILGEVSIGDGLQLIGDVLTTTGAGTPISSLVDAVALNAIDNGNWLQSWSWDTLNGPGLVLASTSTVAEVNYHRLLTVDTTGANAFSSVSTYSGYFSNTHTGTSSTNYAIYTTASGATTNYGLYVDDGDFFVNTGNIYFNTIAINSGQDRLIGQNTLTKEVNAVGIGSGLTLSGGVLSASVAGTQTFQNTLTVGSTLTGNNTVAGGGFNFVWNNFTDYTINATGKLFLKVANFGAASPGDVLTLVSTVTGEVNFQAPGAGSSGTVTSFSAGDLSGFFTTTESTVTTTPALAFAIVNAGSHTYWGNNTGSTAAPAYKSNAAFVRVNDTNVTMTLSGNPTTALLETMTATLGWTGELAADRGGTGFSSYTLGDMLYADGVTTLGQLSIGTPNQILRVNAGGTAPEWYTAAFGTVTLVSSGNLAPLFTVGVTNPTTTPTFAFTLTNAAANTYFGNATTGSAAPSYTAAGALTAVSDTNIVLTAGGNSATSLLRAASITASWSGTLGVARGGTNIASYSVGDIIRATGATTLTKLALGAPGQQLRVNAGATDIEWATIANGITTLNTLTAAVQTFAVGTSGSDFNISSVTSTHTFNIPSAGIGVTRGLITNTGQTIGGEKDFNVGIIVNASQANSAASGNFTVRTAFNNFAIATDATNDRVGIFNGSPSYPLDISGNTRITGGTLGIGTIPSASVGISFGGSAWSASAIDTIAVSIASTAGTSPAIVNLGGTIIEATSGTHTLFSTLAVAPFATTAGLAAVTDAATLSISGAPTTTVTGGVYALLVSAGTSRFNGDVRFGTSSNVLMTTGTAYSAGGRDMTVRNQATGRLEVMDPDIVTLNTQSGTNYTLVLSDKESKYVRRTNASAQTLTVPTNASVAFPVGTTIIVVQAGAGQVTFTPSGGVTINAADGATKTRVQYASGTLIKVATDTWDLIGDLTT